MGNLKRKSFYLPESQYRQLVDYVYRSYVETGRRLTESEVVREALSLYFESRKRPPTETDPGREP